MWYGIYDFGWPTEIPDLPDTCHKWLYADVTGGDVILARKKPEWVVIQCRAGLRDNDIFDPGILENRIQNLSYQCAAWKIPFYITPGARKFLSVEEGKMDWPEEMIKYLRDNLHTKEQERILYTECDICRKTFRKREMYPIDTRKSGMGQKNVGYVCQECASILEQEYGFRFSRLEEAHEKTKL